MTAREIPISDAADKAASETEETVEAVDEQLEAAEAEEAEVVEEADASDEAEENAVEAEEAEEPEPTSADEVALAKAEAAEYRDRYVRLQAEWDNFRKRTAAERKSERERAAEKLVTDLLPAFDDIERAIRHAKESGDGSSLVEGVEAIQNKFMQILEKHKVSQVPAQGEPFDAMKHQAIGTTEDESVPE